MYCFYLIQQIRDFEKKKKKKTYSLKLSISGYNKTISIRVTLRTVIVFSQVTQLNIQIYPKRTCLLRFVCFLLLLLFVCLCVVVCCCFFCCCCFVVVVVFGFLLLFFFVLFCIRFDQQCCLQGGYLTYSLEIHQTMTRRCRLTDLHSGCAGQQAVI